MPLTIPKLLTLPEHTDHAPLLAKDSRYGDDIKVHDYEMTDEMLAAIRDAAVSAGNGGMARACAAIMAARAGDTNKKVPSLYSAPEMFLAYFRENLRDGWLYERKRDGHLHAWLVTEVKIIDPKNDSKPYMSVTLKANGGMSATGRSGSKMLGTVESSLHFDSDDVRNKIVSDALTAKDVLIETPDLRAEYDAGIAVYEEMLNTGFAEQFRYTGTPLADSERYSSKGLNKRFNRKVVHDLHSDEIVAPTLTAGSDVFEKPAGEKVERAHKRLKIEADEHGVNWGVGPLPTHFVVRVFDLAAQDFVWVNALDCVRYVYDKGLRDKIILPEDQRNLLDILTSDLDDFTADIIEGKSAGNVVLCKGKPGVGKTLTAEVYAELIERPLYSIHSGNLGVSADDVRKNLEVAFDRAERWKAVLLLDEADVFVLERGNNIQQNAIVAEFLRTLEYFTGLMFMTTNRANNIDDAILSRAAAIIDYAIPEPEGIREVWKVLAANNDATLNDDLLEDLVWGFKVITPRDVKMLLRLALRVAKGNDEPLSADIFARCAMFRGLHFEKGSRA